MTIDQNERSRLRGACRSVPPRPAEQKLVLDVLKRYPNLETLKLEMSDVKVESLVPSDLEGGSIDEFLDGLSRYDAAMHKRYEAARQAGKVLRFVGRITARGEATVGVVELDRKHAFANIALTDNVVRFATARYCNNPLIVQGPGAGPEVTAGGVFADLLRLSAYLGSRL